MPEYINRHMEEQITRMSEYYPVIMVCGQRQVGKSTMLHHMMKEDRKYVTLDDRNARRLAENDPGLFFETYGFPVLIDEVQRVPSIFLEIKRIVDEKILAGENFNGMIWLTGSQKFQMMKGISESLSGRVAIFEMSGISCAEAENRPSSLFHPSVDSLRERMKTSIPKNINEIFERIFRGGMPKLITTDLDRDRYFMDYVNTYLERDIHLIENVDKLNEFYDFLVYMAARTSQELNYSEISKELGISVPTAKGWTTILERSGIIYILRPYYNNITNRLVKTPKMYFMDTGLAAYLCRWPNAETLANGAMSGAYFETYVITEIVKSYYNAGKKADLYYYRDIDRKEIDLLITEGNKIYPVEIKKSKNPARPDKNFSVLEKFKMDIQKGIILCMSDELIPLNRETWLCPVSCL